MKDTHSLHQRLLLQLLLGDPIHLGLGAGPELKDGEKMNLGLFISPPVTKT